MPNIVKFTPKHSALALQSLLLIAGCDFAKATKLEIEAPPMARLGTSFVPKIRVLDQHGQAMEVDPLPSVTMEDQKTAIFNEGKVTTSRPGEGAIIATYGDLSARHDFTVAEPIIGLWKVDTWRFPWREEFPPYYFDGAAFIAPTQDQWNKTRKDAGNQSPFWSSMTGLVIEVKQDRSGEINAYFQDASGVDYAKLNIELGENALTVDYFADSKNGTATDIVKRCFEGHVAGGGRLIHSIALGSRHNGYNGKVPHEGVPFNVWESGCIPASPYTRDAQFVISDDGMTMQGTTDATGSQMIAHFVGLPSDSAR